MSLDDIRGFRQLQVVGALYLAWMFGPTHDWIASACSLIMTILP